MIEREEHFWEGPDGIEYRVGDVIPILRLPGLVMFNETIVLATCDMCEWQSLGPTSFIQGASQSHIATHIVSELDDFADDFRHPDFKE